MGNTTETAGPERFPTWLSTFIGRVTEQKVLGQLLDEQRLVTVVGPGGGGKTRLAAQVAGDRARDRPTWFATLGAVVDEAGVVPALRTAVGAPEQAWRPSIDTVADWIDQGHALLVVDNAEHLTPVTAAAVATLLDRCPGLTVLVTSRQPLGLDGEMVWPLPPLETPDTVDHPDTAASYDAVRLFADRARLACPDLELTDQTTPVVVELVRRLDGMALAIELAAARDGHDDPGPDPRRTGRPVPTADPRR